MSAAAIVYVVDDDASVRKAVTRLLRADGLQVEAFERASAFLEHEREDAAGCVILDVQMPGLSGMELQEELVAHGVDLPIVFMTGHGDIPMSVKAMKGGAVDFLPKPVGDELLLETVRRALDGHARRRLETAELGESRRRLGSLTRREYEVMTLVVSGMLNKQIAFKLGISLDTVKVHRGRVMAKSGVDSLAELVRLYERAQLAPRGPA